MQTRVEENRWWRSVVLEIVGGLKVTFLSCMQIRSCDMDAHSHTSLLTWSYAKITFRRDFGMAQTGDGKR